MRRCPLSWLEIPDDALYHPRGLRMLAPGLTRLSPLELDAEGLRREAARRARKMSIQGVQPKLSATLNVGEGRFAFVDRGGRFIVKPPHPIFRALPENEALTMRLAASVDIEVPDHGLLRGRDDQLSYVIRRFDRAGDTRIPVEDGSQLAGRSRDTKYDYSIERLVPLLRDYCTFPRLELLRLFRLILFSFLVGNEDMHLKNVSLITTDGRTRLSPAYDLLNTTIALGPDAEETALPINGKRRGLTRRMMTAYLGGERFGLPQRQVDAEMGRLRDALPAWSDTIEASFLPDDQKDAYRTLLEERAERLL